MAIEATCQALQYLHILCAHQRLDLCKLAQPDTSVGWLSAVMCVCVSVLDVASRQHTSTNSEPTHK